MSEEEGSSSIGPAGAEGTVFGMDALTSRERYQLLTSLIVPRPIGWISSISSAGSLNLAPFSYFAALTPSPMLIGVSIGSRQGGPKDTLRNIRDTGVFCVNVVTEEHLAAMNESAGEHPPEVDEFEVAGVLPARGEFVDAPYVAGCPAVLECRLHREVDLDAGGTVLLVGRVVGVRLEPHLKFAEGSYLIAPETLRPVGRLGGEFYSLLGELRALPRPVIADAGAPPVGAGPVQAR